MTGNTYARVVDVDHPMMLWAKPKFEASPFGLSGEGKKKLFSRVQATSGHDQHVEVLGCTRHVFSWQLSASPDVFFPSGGSGGVTVLQAFLVGLALLGPKCRSTLVSNFSMYAVPTPKVYNGAVTDIGDGYGSTQNVVRD